VGYIKGKSAIHLARTFAGRKRNDTGQHFWAQGYYVSTVGREEATIRDYIRTMSWILSRLANSCHSPRRFLQSYPELACLWVLPPCLWALILACYESGKKEGGLVNIHSAISTVAGVASDLARALPLHKGIVRRAACP
jgi:hypothetical protein